MEPQSLLWSVKGKAATVFLLGSLHLLTKDSLSISREIHKAYERAETIVFETNPEGMTDPVVRQKMLGLGLYPKGETLRQHVSEETYRLLERKAAAEGLPMEELDRLKPWLCALTLHARELQRLGFNPKYGIDSHFYEKAKTDKKAMVFLETVEFQLELFASLDRYGQESFLRQTLNDLQVIETMASDLIAAWKGGDARRVDAIIDMSFKDHADIYDRLVVQRNRAWLPRIRKMMKGHNDVFVVVGAGHLVGESGLVERLRRSGHKVTQY
jgi:hypothetical protein